MSYRIPLERAELWVRRIIKQRELNGPQFTSQFVEAQARRLTLVRATAHLDGPFTVVVLHARKRRTYAGASKRNPIDLGAKIGKAHLAEKRAVRNWLVGEGIIE